MRQKTNNNNNNKNEQHKPDGYLSNKQKQTTMKTLRQKTEEKRKRNKEQHDGYLSSPSKTVNLQPTTFCVGLNIIPSWDWYRPVTIPTSYQQQSRWEAAKASHEHYIIHFHTSLADWGGVWGVEGVCMVCVCVCVCACAHASTHKSVQGAVGACLEVGVMLESQQEIGVHKFDNPWKNAKTAGRDPTP